MWEFYMMNPQTCKEANELIIHVLIKFIKGINKFSGQEQQSV